MKLYLTLESEDGLRKSEKVMFVDETTLGRHDIYGQAIEEMYEMVKEEFDKLKVNPTPLEIDLSPDDEVYKPSN